MNNNLPPQFLQQANSNGSNVPQDLLQQNLAQLRISSQGAPQQQPLQQSQQPLQGLMMSPQIQNRLYQQQQYQLLQQQQQQQQHAQSTVSQTGVSNQPLHHLQQQFHQPLNQQQQQYQQQVLQQQLALQQQQQQQQQLPQLQKQQQLNLQLLQQQPQLQHQQLQSLILPSQVRDVWAENLYKEVAYINEIISKYNVVSISTEFPGVVARPIGNFRSLDDFHYQTMRSNADIMNLIQLGLTFTDNEDSLIKTGINFSKHEQFGIEPSLFAKVLQGSGLCLDDDITWISYHAGYDLGFLISLLTNKEMPVDRQDFKYWIDLYFPNVYDIKFISKRIFQDHSASKSLENLCEELTTIPSAYIAANQFLAQVGGQSFLTNSCFQALKKLIIMKTKSTEVLDKYKGHLWGITDINTEDSFSGSGSQTAPPSSFSQTSQNSFNSKDMGIVDGGGILSPKASGIPNYFGGRI